jgi:hypothetical protein
MSKYTLRCCAVIRSVDTHVVGCKRWQQSTDDVVVDEEDRSTDGRKDISDDGRTSSLSWFYVPWLMRAPKLVTFDSTDAKRNWNCVVHWNYVQYFKVCETQLIRFSV